VLVVNFGAVQRQAQPLFRLPFQDGNLGDLEICIRSGYWIAFPFEQAARFFQGL
jgi:hypothetical protein